MRWSLSTVTSLNSGFWSMGWAALQWDSNWFPKFQARPLHFQAQPVNPGSQQHQHDVKELHGDLSDLHQPPRPPSQLSRGLQPIALKYFLSWHGKTLWYQMRKVFLNYKIRKYTTRWSASHQQQRHRTSISQTPTTAESSGNAGDFWSGLCLCLCLCLLAILSQSEEISGNRWKNHENINDNESLHLNIDLRDVSPSNKSGKQICQVYGRKTCKNN